MGKDFNETASLLKLLVDFGNAVKRPQPLINTVINATTEEERAFLSHVTLPATSELALVSALKGDEEEKMLNGSKKIEKAIQLEAFSPFPGGLQNGGGASIGSVAPFFPQLLPIRTVGVQGDCRTYSYVAALSSDREPCTASEWSDISKLATIIPRVCHKINR